MRASRGISHSCSTNVRAPATATLAGSARSEPLSTSSTAATSPTVRVICPITLLPNTGSANP
ncbi:MAG: hypothetical protein AUH79_00070 [Betaproteobacteria bacterium 13_1_40CM_4_64_4]|nr:MAG: hypothetical protein AUH79_00070 [Betaproteobacteria bacterium 13_1_40CM_4_64_4]